MRAHPTVASSRFAHSGRDSCLYSANISRGFVTAPCSTISRWITRLYEIHVRVTLLLILLLDTILLDTICARSRPHQRHPASA
jgi:hypothetical protein